LELIKDLSTVSFLHGLKRFICTRRRPRQIWSDNATNFVGTRNELLELRRLYLSSDHQKATLDFCLAEVIDWCFIPPISPHYLPFLRKKKHSFKKHFPLPHFTALIAQDISNDIVLFATAIVLVKKRSGVFVPCRALLDSGSQLHLLTSRFANQLQVKKIKSSASVTGIGGMVTRSILRFSPELPHTQPTLPRRLLRT